MRKNLAAKAASLVVMLDVIAPAHAQGIPVIDATNVVQTTVSAMQNVAAVEKQIQQYETQLQQYQNMLQNTLAPAAWVWNQADQVINKIVQAQDTLTNFKNQAGNLDNFLAQYGNVNYYKSSPCLTSTGCSSTQMQALQSANATNAANVKAANDALLQGVNQQQSTLQSDAASLVQLQSQATSATGQMQAIQAANQLASAQANQLLQIRSILVAQQTAAATLAENNAAVIAQHAAGDQQALSGTNTASSAKTW